MESFNNESRQETLKRRLWQFAEVVGNELCELEDEQRRLYEEIQALRIHPNLHEREILIEKEKRYWELNERIQSLKEKENTTQNHLLAVEEGSFSAEEIDSFLPHEAENGPKISKRKQRIQEERERDLSDGGFGVGYNYNYGWGRASHDRHNPNRLTTGRHATGIKGNMSVYEGEQRFMDATTDTHGGKVRKRKQGSGYISSGGKRIRKR